MNGTVSRAPSQRRIFAFPFHDWTKAQLQGFRTRDAHLLQAFARRSDVARILVVNRPTSRAERLLRRTPERPTGELVAEWRQGPGRVTITQVDEHIQTLDVAYKDVIAPLQHRHGWWFDVFKRPEIAVAVERAARDHLGGPTDVLAWVPTVAPVLFLIGGRVVFDSLDNWLIHPELRLHATDAEMAYQAILQRADEVFASGPASARVLARWRADITVLPNGVDREVFAGDWRRPADLPTGPLVGYAGKLAERIDDDLVAEVAAALPDVSFAFVGPVSSRRAVRNMRRQANVHLLGDRPYSRLPGYLQAFDIAWIPHRVGQGETGGDPIKLYEYWAAGKQVVSTRIDGSDQWVAQVRMVDDAADAISAIHGILTRTLPPLPTAVPPGRTWDEIADVVLGGSPAADSTNVIA